MTDAFERVVERERDAKRQRWVAKRRQALRFHAFIFLAVNAGMVVAWVTERIALDPDHPMWFLPVLLGWGTGLAIHWYVVQRADRRRAEG